VAEGTSPSFRKEGAEPYRAEVEAVATLARFLTEDWAVTAWLEKHMNNAMIMTEAEIRDFMDFGIF
jgi:hypothetical protein